MIRQAQSSLPNESCRQSGDDFIVEYQASVSHWFEAIIHAQHEKVEALSAEWVVSETDNHRFHEGEQ
jgi:hypothetical protein